jgi:hypothetical protein
VEKERLKKAQERDFSPHLWKLSRKNTSMRASMEQKHMRSVGADVSLVLDKIEK